MNSTPTTSHSLSIPSKSLSNYTIGRTIGKGTYGTVFIAQEKSTNQIFAIKSIRKSQIQSFSSYSFIKSEKNILSEVNSPFAVSFYGSFQDSSSIYLIQEFIPGGELFSLISSNIKIPLSQSKLICAELVLFLNSIHKQNIVYRDLKPENVLISATGHVKVVDFGFASKTTEVFQGFCGTLEYLAPEVVRRQRHGIEVDWWTLGVLMFEMMTGKCPFSGQLNSEVFEKILKSTPEFPNGFDGEAKDLIGKLLEKEAEKRIKGEEVMKHEFFKEVYWEDVEKMGYETFEVPDLSDGMDTKYFPVYGEGRFWANGGVKYSFLGF